MWSLPECSRRRQFSESGSLRHMSVSHCLITIILASNESVWLISKLLQGKVLVAMMKHTSEKWKREGQYLVINLARTSAKNEQKMRNQYRDDAERKRERQTESQHRVFLPPLLLLVCCVLRSTIYTQHAEVQLHDFQSSWACRSKVGWNGSWNGQPLNQCPERRSTSDIWRTEWHRRTSECRDFSSTLGWRRNSDEVRISQSCKTDVTLFEKGNFSSLAIVESWPIAAWISDFQCLTQSIRTLSKSHQSSLWQTLQRSIFNVHQTKTSTESWARAATRCSNTGTTSTAYTLSDTETERKSRLSSSGSVSTGTAWLAICCEPVRDDATCTCCLLSAANADEYATDSRTISEQCS